MRTDQIETVVAGDMALAALRRRLYSLAFLWSLILLLGYRLLAAAWGPQFALRWVGLAALVLAYQHVQLARSLILNRRPGECELLSTYGVGNHLSMLRGLCIGLLAGFLFLERPPGGLAWAPVILYTSADLLDYFDGYLARITNHATQLGEALDLELDALGLLVAVSLAIWYGALPWWFAPFGLARYAFSFGLRLRGRLGLKTYPLPPSLSRRPIAGLAMGFMSAVLWPIVSQPATTIAGALFLAPFGASFLRDWLVVSGVLDPASERYHSLRRAVVTIATIWLPLPLRAALGVSVVSMAVSKLVQFSWHAEVLASLGYRWPKAAVAFFVFVELVGVVLVAAGVAARFAAFGMIFPVGLTIAALGLDPVRSAALISVLSVLILGSGRFSLWKPEERLFRSRAGAQDE